jgi:hypothetical protein
MNDQKLNSDFADKTVYYMMSRKGLPAEYQQMACEMARWLVHHLDLRDKAMKAHESLIMGFSWNAEQDKKRREVAEDLLDWLVPNWRDQIGHGYV